MNITVFCGSPKGKISVTYQYLHFLQQEYPKHRFELFYPGQQIRAILQKKEKWDDILNSIKQADLILWAFPVYIFLVPAGLKRFIEALFEKKTDSLFAGKYSAALSTSIHFYDHTAHEYIRGISEDLGMNYAGYHSAKMDDLLEPRGQSMLKGFFDATVEAVELEHTFPRETAPVPAAEWTYTPGRPARNVSTGKRVLILTDNLEGNTGAMVQHLSGGIDGMVDVAELKDAGIKGDCMGCMKCGDKNICAYEGKDGFGSFYRDRIKPADIIIYAGTLKDRYLSWQWKQFFDRSFFNTHQRTLNNKHFGLIVSGGLSTANALKQLFKAYVEWQGSTLCGMISDECRHGEQIDRMLDSLIQRAVYQAEHNIHVPETFLGIGGMKVFRDDIYEKLKIVFRADHRNYRKTGVYDYVQKHPLKRFAVNAAYLITGIPFIKKQMRRYMNKGMIQPYRKLFTNPDT